MRSIVYTLLLISIIITLTLCNECPPLRSENVNKACEYPGKGPVSCESRIQPGTKANVTCKPLFEYSAASPYPPHREITCLKNGTWHPPSFDCVPECGSTRLPVYPQIVNGWTTELETFPWHVGVFEMDWTAGTLNSNICGGSLISTELVVSAAHCFYNETGDRRRPARDYAVAAGKLSRSWYEYEDNEQKSPIRKIYVPNHYGGDRLQHRKDIAILRLDKSFEVTSYVRPVCVDISNAYTEQQLHSQQNGKVMGWGVNAEGYQSETLQGINLPYVDLNSCKEKAQQGFKRFLTDDKICAGYLNGSSTCQGDSGGGLCFRSNGSRWYLRGIVSSGDLIKEGNITRCNNYYYTAFTNIANYTHWIKDVMTGAKNPRHRMSCENNNVQSCIMPNPPTNGYFEHELCKGSCNYVPGIILPMGSVLRYNCDKGYSLHGDSTLICANAVWSLPPTCIKLTNLTYCPSVPSLDGLNAVCQYDDGIASCERDVVPGTKAILQCHNNYKMNSHGDNSTRIEVTCSSNGTWDTNPSLYRCTPECGIAPDRRESTRFVNGTEVYLGDIPWPVFTSADHEAHTDHETHTDHVLMRQALSFVCGGTLVTPSLVIASGNCQPRYQRFDVGRSTGLYRVYDSFDGLRYPDIYPMEAVKFDCEQYEPRSYRSNRIMVLRLRRDDHPTRILCMDWSLELDIPRAGEVGMIFMFGYEKTSPEEILSYPTRVISNEECQPLLRKELHQVTRDQFCIEQPRDLHDKPLGRYGNFAVRRNGLWYLSGVANRIEDGKQDKSFIILTKIATHMNWLKRFRNSSGASAPHWQCFWE